MLRKLAILWPARGHLRPLVLAGALLIALAVPASGDRQSEGRALDSGPEPILAKVLVEVQRQRLDSALQLVEELIERYPTFRLGHLIKGDLLLARTQALTTFGNVRETPSRAIDGLRAEALARLAAYTHKPAAERLPRQLLELSPEQHFAVLVDTSKSRLYLYQNDNGRLRLAADFYASQGRAGSAKQREGDLKTPVGVYHVTAHLPPEKLTDFYGSGAFPINYPNDWDRRSGRTGHGIWLHGTPPGTFSRVPLASEGCVVLANPDLETLGQSLQIGVTPVIIANGIDWRSETEWESERNGIKQAIENWRQDWESRDMNRYLRHYASSFETSGQSRESFAANKRAVNSGKEWIKVRLDKLSIFANPGADDFLVVTFDQDYSSNNLSNRMRKQQYWIREGDGWKIFHEGNA